MVGQPSRRGNWHGGPGEGEATGANGEGEAGGRASGGGHLGTAGDMAKDRLTIARDILKGELAATKLQEGNLVGKQDGRWIDRDDVDKRENPAKVLLWQSDQVARRSTGQKTW